MRRNVLAFAISASLASVAAATDPDAWRADPNYDPEYGELAAPRTHTHPIDQMVFLADHGIEAAQQTLAEWEADPAYRERLHQRQAYREYARDRARTNLKQRLADQQGKQSAQEQDQPGEGKSAVAKQAEPQAQEKQQTPAGDIELARSRKAGLEH